MTKRATEWTSHLSLVRRDRSQYIRPRFAIQRRTMRLQASGRLSPFVIRTVAITRYGKCTRARVKARGRICGSYMAGAGAEHGRLRPARDLLLQECLCFTS